MSYVSATGAERLAVNTAAHNLAKATEAARSNFAPTGISNDADVEAAAAAVNAALTAVDLGAEPAPLPSNQAIVADGDSFEVVGGTVTAVVVESAVTFTFTPEEP